MQPLVAESPAVAYVRRPGDQALVRLGLLRQLSEALAQGASVDGVVGAILKTAATLPDVVRGGMALTFAGGRQLRFTAMHQETAGGRIDWCSLDATSDLPVVISTRTGRPLWFSTYDDLEQRFPALAAHERKFGTEGFATIPLRLGDRVLGALMLCYAAEQPFAEVEQAFLEAFAAESTHALMRAMAWDQQRDVAELLQYSLLPEITPDIPGLAIAARYEPASAGTEVGGDWFDVIPLPDGAVVVVIGDVMGRGVPAATLMGQMRTALRAYALLDPAPDVVLGRLDALVAAHEVPEQIVTVLVAVVDADRRTVRIASAGHPPPVYAAEAMPARPVDLPIDPPLGLSVGDRAMFTLPIKSGDVLILYTDGLVESAQRPIEDGIAQLCKALDESVGQSRMPQEMCTRLATLLAEPIGDDDRALVVLASTAGRRSRTAHTRLPGDSRAPRVGRRWLCDHLTQWGLPTSVVDDAELCLSEIVTNAVIHTGTEPRVAATLDDGHLLVAVHDSGRHGRAQRLLGDPDEIGGRGLVVVDALAANWNAERRADGTTVWFQLQIQPSESQ